MGLHRNSYRAKVKALLDHYKPNLLAGPIRLTIPEGGSPKSFAVYARDWYRPSFNGDPKSFLFISINLRAAVLEIRSRSIIHAVSVDGTPPLHSAGKHERDLLEIWAEFCLASSIPLEDIFAAASNTVPNFEPRSAEGQSFLRRLRHQ